LQFLGFPGDETQTLPVAPLRALGTPPHEEGEWFFMLKVDHLGILQSGMGKGGQASLGPNTSRFGRRTIQIESLTMATNGDLKVGFSYLATA